MNRDNYFDQLEVKKIEIPGPKMAKKRPIRLPDTLIDVILTTYVKGKIVSEEVVKVAKTNIRYE
jgi:hypothetical protein